MASVGKYVVGRLLQAVVLLAVVSVITFALIMAAPGGPAILYDPSITADEAERIRALLGLDQPAHIQYLRWLGNVIRGDLGTSYTLGLPVAEVIAHRLPATLLLSGASILFAVALGIPLGMLSAVRRNSWIDNAVTAISFMGMSIPVFWYGLMLMILFSVRWRLLPAGGLETDTVASTLKHLVLPAVVLGTVHMAEITRYTRASMLSVLHQDYIRTARAKGVKETWVLAKHALKNAILPVVTVIGLLLPKVATGSAITEQVFAWPGMGQLAVRAAYQRDYPVIMGVTLVVSVVVILCNLVVDLLYVYLDPRVRYE